MANAFSKEEIVLFEEILEKFDPNNISAKQVSVRTPTMQQQERAGYTDWRPMPYVSQTVSGLDITGQAGDLTQLSVPTRIDVIENVPWKMNAQELNDPQQRTRKADSAVQQLSALVDRAVANLVGLTGTLVVTSNGPSSGYDDIAAMETRMIEEDINVGAMRTSILNARDWQGMSSNLANRETMQGKPNSAYERSYVGPVAGFDTFRASFQPTLAPAAGTVSTGGAPQSHVPTATLPNNVNGGQANVDNRYFDLDVNTTTGVAVGDVFTIAGVNAVSMIHKNDTLQLRTFRVVDVIDSTTLRIYPAPVVKDGPTLPEKEYANVSAPIPASTALTFLNTVAAPVNTFWMNDSIELTGGSLATPPSDMAGVATERTATDSGIELLFAKGGDVNTLTATYRVTIFFGVTNLQPQMNGISIFNQT